MSTLHAHTTSADQRESAGTRSHAVETVRAAAASLQRRRARARHLGAHRRDPPRKASQDLRRHAEPARRRHAVRDSVARGDHQGHGRKARRGQDLQQRGAGVEPRVLLALPEAFRWRPAGRRIRRPARERVRKLRSVQEGILEGCGRAVRQRLGVARRRGRQAEGRHDRQCRSAVHQRADSAADDRRLGARLLSRLPESPRRPRQRGDRPPARLAVRCLALNHRGRFRAAQFAALRSGG